MKDEWLIAENIDGVRQYVIHAHYPRFIAEILDNEVLNPEWIDPVETADVQTIARLMRRAADAVATYDELLDMEVGNEEE